MPNLRRRDDVFLLDLGEDENLLNPDMIGGVSELLDEVERAPEPRALVTHGRGRFYSSGLDLGWIASHLDRLDELARGFHDVLARVLELPVPTVAALNGHAFAGGAMLALAHDHRVMRQDRGYFCLPEVDARIPFTRGVSDLVTARLAPQVAHEATTTGRRYTGPEAQSLAIVDRIAAADEVVTAAVDLARPLAGKDRVTLGLIKARLYRRAVRSLRDADANLADVVEAQKLLGEAMPGPSS